MPRICVRLGFVANAMRLPDASPSHTTTLASLARLDSEQARRGRLLSLARLNLANTLRILRANVADGIMFYRLTSKLVPLATHPQVEGWEYWLSLGPELAEIGAFIRDHGLRVGAHPDHFTLLNSPRPEVIEAAFKDLAYHERIFTAMGLPGAPLVLHVGGGYHDPHMARGRFRANFARLPAATAHRIILENDDRTHDAQDVLSLCRELGLSMVLDAHHHSILPGEKSLAALLPQIMDTWGQKRPAFHFSSPKSASDRRSHADYIECRPFLEFLLLAARAGRDFDIMLEAKAKDLALLRLAEELAKKRGVHVRTPGEIELTI